MPQLSLLSAAASNGSMAPDRRESWECYEGDLDCPLCIRQPSPGRPRTIPSDHTSTLPHSLLRCPGREQPIDTLFDRCYNRYNVEPTSEKIEVQPYVRLTFVTKFLLIRLSQPLIRFVYHFSDGCAVWRKVL